jgi:hypothetical protein
MEDLETTQAETTESTPTEPEEIEAPDWVYGVSAPAQPPQQQWGGYQQSPPPVPPPQYTPPPQQDDPSAFINDLATRGKGAIEGIVNPFIQRQAAMENIVRGQIERGIQTADSTAKQSIAAAYKQVFSKDPAFSNKTIRGMVESSLAQWYMDGQKEAWQSGNTAKLEALSNPKFYEMALASAKIHTGYTGSGKPVSMPGAFTESSRSMAAPSSSSDEIDDETKQALIKIGIPEEKWKERMKKQREMGW